MGRAVLSKQRKRTKHAKASKAVAEAKKTKQFITVVLSDILDNVESTKQATKDCKYLLHNIIDDLGVSEPLSSADSPLHDPSNVKKVNYNDCELTSLGQCATSASDEYDFTWGSVEEFNFVATVSREHDYNKLEKNSYTIPLSTNEIDTIWEKGFITKQQILVNDVKTEFEPNEYFSTNQDPLALQPPISKIKVEEDSDIDIKEHDIKMFDNSNEFESASDNYINNIDQSEFQTDTHEITTGLYNNTANCEPSTSTSKKNQASNITSSLLTKQAIQNRWKIIVKNIPEKIIKDAAQTAKTRSSSMNAKEKTNIKNAPELCVLCAKDISKIRSKKSVAMFSVLILTVTNVDVTQYPILPLCCGTCYSELSAIKKFQRKVLDARFLINKTLSQLSQSKVHKHTQTELEDPEETDLSDTENFAVTGLIENPSRNTENAINSSASQAVNPSQSDIKNENKNKKSRDKLICSQCDKFYPDTFKLKLHEVTHGEKKHLCAFCGLSFHFREYLSRHMKSHSGEKPYACITCKKTFGTAWNLTQHRRLHTNSKPYKCKVCSAAFRHNVTLKGHLATSHTANEIAASKSKRL